MYRRDLFFLPSAPSSPNLPPPDLPTITHKLSQCSVMWLGCALAEGSGNPTCITFHGKVYSFFLPNHRVLGSKLPPAGRVHLVVS